MGAGYIHISNRSHKQMFGSCEPSPHCIRFWSLQLVKLLYLLWKWLYLPCLKLCSSRTIQMLEHLSPSWDFKLAWADLGSVTLSKKYGVLQAISRKLPRMTVCSTYVVQVLNSHGSYLRGFHRMIFLHECHKTMTFSYLRNFPSLAFSVNSREYMMTFHEPTAAQWLWKIVFSMGFRR